MTENAKTTELVPFVVVEAVTNGICVELTSPRRVADVSIGRKFLQMGKIGDVVLIPFGRKIRFYERHSWTVFTPLEKEAGKKGFQVKNFVDMRSLGGVLTERTAILLANVPDENGKTFKFIEYNEKEQALNAGGSGGENTEIPANEVAPLMQPSQPSQSNAIANQSKNVLVEPEPQTRKEKKSNPWNLILLIIGILFATILVFFGIRKR